MTNYAGMDGLTLYNELGIDAAKWAAAFSQIAATHGIAVDADWAQMWFANAMMAMHDHVCRERGDNPPFSPS